MRIEAAKLPLWAFALLVGVSSCSTVNGRAPLDCADLFRSAQEQRGVSSPRNIQELFWSTIAASASPNVFSDITDMEYIFRISGGSNIEAANSKDRTSFRVVGFGPQFPIKGPIYPSKEPISYEVRYRSKNSKVSLYTFNIWLANSANEIRYDDVDLLLGGDWKVARIEYAHRDQQPIPTHPVGDRYLTKTCQLLGGKVSFLLRTEPDGNLQSLFIQGEVEDRS
jgi:hypothetical protein